MTTVRMPDEPFPAEEVREHIRRSREIEDAAYDGSTSEYDTAFHGGCRLFDAAARPTQRFRKIDSSSLYQESGAITILRHMMKPYMAQDRLGQLAGLRKGVIQRIEGGGLAEREDLEAIAEVINRYLDRDRLPWLAHTLGKAEEDHEFDWSRRWTASNYANITSRKVQRMSVSGAQEDDIAKAIQDAGWTEALHSPPIVARITDVSVGSYTKERRIMCSPPPNKKADSVIRLDTSRLLLIEAKHNIDELNARKRIAEVRDKATKWRQSLGPHRVVVCAVLSGYFPEVEVRSLWDDNILVFWKHDLTRLRQWLNDNGSRK